MLLCCALSVLNYFTLTSTISFHCATFYWTFSLVLITKMFQFFKVIIFFHFQRTGVQSIKHKQEKSTAILIAIIVVFVTCHVHRLTFRIYEMSLPEGSVFEHYSFCKAQEKYHIPVGLYLMAISHYFFIVVSSSINFIIYCAMGRQFRMELKSLCKR